MMTEIWDPISLSIRPPPRRAGLDVTTPSPVINRRYRLLFIFHIDVEELLSGRRSQAGGRLSLPTQYFLAARLQIGTMTRSEWGARNIMEDIYSIALIPIAINWTLGLL